MALAATVGGALGRGDPPGAAGRDGSGRGGSARGVTLGAAAGGAGRGLGGGAGRETGAAATGAEGGGVGGAGAGGGAATAAASGLPSRCTPKTALHTEQRARTPASGTLAGSTRNTVAQLGQVTFIALSS